MKETVSVAPAVTMQEAVLPARVQEASGELVGAAKEGLLALSVATGLGVLAELLEEEVDDVVGPKGRRNAERIAVRHGHEAGEVTLGGRRVAVERPRARTVDGESEVPLATYAHFADRDPLTRVVLERMLAGVSTRRFAARVSRSARTCSSRALDLEVGGVARVRRPHPRAPRRADGPLAGGHPPGGADARRDRAEGPLLRRRAGHHDRRDQGPARAVGRLDGEQDRRRAPALRPRRPRPGCRAGRARRPRRIQGAARGGPRGVRPRAGPALRASQGAQRPRSPARARPPRDQGTAAPRVGQRRPRARARRPARRWPTSSSARIPAPPLAARGHGGDAHPHPAAGSAGG